MPIPKAVMRESILDLKAVSLLSQGECDTHAIALVYSSIDKMAWLQSPSVDHNGKDFQHWVNTYMLVDEEFAFDAEDLWAARCGLLHTGTLESKLYRDGKARRIIYATGPTRSSAEVKAELDTLITADIAAREDFVILQCSQLMSLWTSAIDRFHSAIETDPGLEQLTRERSSKYLGFVLTATKYGALIKVHLLAGLYCRL